MAERTKVFISYSHDSAEHRKRVLDLADALRHGGLEVILDQYVHPAPEEGWPRWMDTRLDQANFILMICTETYRRRVMGQEQPDKGLGVRWEGNLIYNRIYHDKPSGTRFIPVVLEGGEPAHIPNPVQGHSFYRISTLDDTDEAFVRLYRHLTDQAPTPPPEIGDIRTLPPPHARWVPSDDSNRKRMLEKVRKIWITGYVQKSLFREVRLMLGLSGRPDAVARPLDLLVRRADHGERLLPPGTRVVDVYDEMDQALLILGAPGSGKTTLLLELCRDLLDRAERDPAHPIPVVFPLSTWAESRRPLVEWLVEELNLRYDVAPELAQAWVNADQVLPLLDALDEVKADHGAACVEAINAFRQSHGLLPLVISSRTADYEARSAKVRVQGAVVAQPLAPQQVELYLTEIGPAEAATMQRVLREDPTLWELLDTPLMLYIMTVAYSGQMASQPPTRGTSNERRDHLFEAYVDKMFQRRGAVCRYSPGQTVHWLSWLARQMANHGQTVFLLERLQFSWLPQGHRRTIHACYLLVLWVLVGLLVTAKPTASGRVTRRASSDPACIFRKPGKGLDGMTEVHETPLPSFRELPLPIDGVSLGLHKTNAPNGGYLT